MSKVKKGTIFKIFIVTLLIILTTISTVNAEWMDAGESSSNNSMSTPNVGYNGAKQELEPYDTDFDTLEGNNNVLCDEQGHELKSKNENNPQWGT